MGNESKGYCLRHQSQSQSQSQSDSNTAQDVSLEGKRIEISGKLSLTEHRYDEGRYRSGSL